ncbi:MAG TPA: hypothetical protein VF123_12990 [Candidatus Sulfotelmatobacter sp.]
MRFDPTGFWGVDGVGGFESGEEGPPPEQALRAMEKAMRQAIRMVRRAECPGLNSEAGDAASIDL